MLSDTQADRSLKFRGKLGWNYKFGVLSIQLAGKATGWRRSPGSEGQRRREFANCCVGRSRLRGCGHRETLTGAEPEQKERASRVVP